MNTIHVIQVTEEYDSEPEAKDGFYFQSIQDGYMGGRILPPSHVRPKWLMQTFHCADGVSIRDWLPDGMRFVLILQSQLKTMGILQL